jgi:hypothetical protein
MKPNTFRGNLDASVAGKHGKYGGMSSYTDQDVSRAREYLLEMGKCPLQSLWEFTDMRAEMEVGSGEGRSAAHMLAEFACYWLNDLKEQLRKQAASQGRVESANVEEAIIDFENRRKYKG